MRFLFNVMKHHYIYKLNGFQCISLKEKKRRKNAVNLVLLTQKRETRSTYLTLWKIIQSNRKSSHRNKDHGQCWKLTRSKVSQCLLKLIIDVIEFTLMLLIKAAKFIIYTYILLIIRYVELILSKSFGKFHSSLIITVLKADRNHLSEYNIQHY